jgi:hypothetical protein
MSRPLSPSAAVAEMGATPKLPISPLVGEMSGRTEGGAVPPAFKCRHQRNGMERRQKHKTRLGGGSSAQISTIDKI